MMIHLPIGIWTHKIPIEIIYGEKCELCVIYIDSIQWFSSFLFLCLSHSLAFFLVLASISNGTLHLFCLFFSSRVCTRFSVYFFYFLFCWWWSANNALNDVNVGRRVSCKSGRKRFIPFMRVMCRSNNGYILYCMPGGTNAFFQTCCSHYFLSFSDSASRSRGGVQQCNACTAKSKHSTHTHGALLCHLTPRNLCTNAKIFHFASFEHGFLTFLPKKKKKKEENKAILWSRIIQQHSSMHKRKATQKMGRRQKKSVETIGWNKCRISKC